MTRPAVRFFDTTSLDPACKGFSGAVHDGRHIHFIPMMHAKGVFHGHLTRFDTLGAFEDPAAWSHINSAAMHPGSRGFVDGFFDGRYLYMIPFHHDRHHGQIARLDTTAEWADPAAWSFFDLQVRLDPACRGYVSGAFDGRHLYLAPYQSDWGTTHGHIVRYDTQLDFQDPASWQHVDAQSIWPQARGYHAAVATADHIWFIPYVRENRDYHGFLIRFDRAGEFLDPSSWQALDLDAAHPGARGFIGGCHHRNRLYLSPYHNGSQRYGTMAMLELDAPFHQEDGWRFFDATSLHPHNRGYFGAVSHGDHVYFIPHCREEGVYQGRILRCDTRMAFSDADAWSVLDSESIHPASKGYIGACVVGDHLYLSPYETEPFVHSGRVACIDLTDPHVWVTGSVPTPREARVH